MRVFAISDLHLCISGAKPMEIFGDGWTNYQQIIKDDWLNKVTQDDVVIIAGDISWAMKLDEAKKDFEYFESLPGKKVIIRGNHDYWWQSITNVRKNLSAGTYALQNDAVKVNNVIFCGTRGWSVEDRNSTKENEKIYKREVIRLELALKSAKALQKDNEKIVCIIHYPPFNSKREQNEFTVLMQEYGVTCCVYGHLHGTSGRCETVEKVRGIDYYLTSCDIVKNKLCEIRL